MKEEEDIIDEDFRIFILSFKIILILSIFILFGTIINSLVSL